MNRQYLFCKLFRFLEDIREKRMSLPTLTDRKLFYFWKLKTNYNSKKMYFIPVRKISRPHANFELCNRISLRKQKGSRNPFSLFTWGPGKVFWAKNRCRGSRDALPLKGVYFLFFCLSYLLYFRMVRILSDMRGWISPTWTGSGEFLLWTN